LVGRPSPIDVPDAAIEAQPEAVPQGVERKAIEGRSLGQIAWMRLKRDKLALAGGVVVILLRGSSPGSAGPTPPGWSRAAGATSSPASSMARRSPC